MFTVIYIPDFALQAVLRNEPELFLKPVALIDGQEKKAPVLQVTKQAREMGVCEGLSSTQASARCSGVIIKPRSSTLEKTATAILLQASYNFSPRIEDTAEGICTMDLQGLRVASNATETSLLNWATPILKALSQLFLRAQIGIAETPNLALHASRRAESCLFVQDPTAFISALPIESLEPIPHIHDILQRWGIHTVGEFTALGKDKIAERLGPEALELFDRASPTETRPLDITIPSEQFSETMEFETEIESLEPLLFILRRFIEQLSRRIDLLHLVVSELTLHLKLASGDTYNSILNVPSPTANVEVLFRMLQTHLENVRTETAIVALELLAKPTRSENFQFGLFEASLRDPNQFAETLARLAALCGNDKVGSATPENTFRPDAFKMGTPTFEPPVDAPTKNPSFAETPVQGLSLRRFRPPFHADVEVQNGRPTFLSSLKLSSPIRKVSGPFRSSGDWWELEKHWQRDEWDIQIADGTLYRIYQAKNDWFIDGTYD